jgi:ribonuclease VapC
LILDSSAVVSVLRQEQGHEDLFGALEGADALAIGAPTLVETGMVAIGRFGEAGRAIVALFVEDWAVEVVPFDDRHAAIAAHAFRRYGKGRHPAALNYGDCMTYATASAADEPLLFVGDDFAQTDLVSARSAAS